MHACSSAPSKATSGPRPGFVYLKEVDSTIQQEMKFATPLNFVGRKLKGYEANECILSEAAAQALFLANAELKQSGMAIKVYDCFRPLRAVRDIMAWAKNLEDEKTKAEFYPRLDKKDLLEMGYLEDRPDHSRGSAVDVSLIWLEESSQSDVQRFGTPYSFFDSLAKANASGLGEEVKRNRELLKSTMEKHGFKSDPSRWWHFTLENEPYANKYFDFLVQ